MTIKSLTILLSTLAVSTVAAAQNQANWLNNTMFESGKYKVVAAVVAAAFILIVAYLIYLDRKVKKLEQREKKESR